MGPEYKNSSVGFLGFFFRQAKIISRIASLRKKTELKVYLEFHENRTKETNKSLSEQVFFLHFLSGGVSQMV